MVDWSGKEWLDVFFYGGLEWNQVVKSFPWWIEVEGSG